MSSEIAFYIEGQQMDPTETAVVHPLVAAVANAAILKTMGKQGLTDPSHIEVIPGNEGLPIFYVQSWHETTTAASTGRFQVNETYFELCQIDGYLGVVTEHDNYFSLKLPQANCLLALACTAIIGEDASRWQPPHWLPGQN